MPQEYYAFNTGGVGADSNEEASGSRYRKIPRELTMMLQEALLRNAVKFEYDGMLRSEVAVAILDGEGNEVVDLRHEWLPVNIYGEDDYADRVVELMRRRYYGRDQQDKAGILRYTKVVNTDPGYHRCSGSGQRAGIVVAAVLLLVAGPGVRNAGGDRGAPLRRYAAGGVPIAGAAAEVRRGISQQLVVGRCCATKPARLGVAGRIDGAPWGR